ncbi:MAG: hypothetical protein P8185_24670 [Deltaproteobacteria bacterium]
MKKLLGCTQQNANSLPNSTAISKMSRNFNIYDLIQIFIIFKIYAVITARTISRAAIEPSGS